MFKHQHNLLPFEKLQQTDANQMFITLQSQLLTN